MAKITLSNILGSYASVTAINAKMNQIEDEFNNKVLYRDNPVGEPNAMAQVLDMNNFQVLNVGAPTTNSAAARLQDLLDSATGISTIGAALVTIVDSGSYYTSTNAEGALQELSQEVKDTSGNAIVTYGTVSGADKGFTITGGSTTAAPKIETSGVGANIDFHIDAKGTGTIELLSDTNITGDLGVTNVVATGTVSVGGTTVLTPTLLDTPVFAFTSTGAVGVWTAVDMTTVFAQAETDGAVIGIFKALVRANMNTNNSSTNVTLYMQKRGLGGAAGVQNTVARAATDRGTAGEPVGIDENLSQFMIPLDANSDAEYQVAVGPGMTFQIDVYFVGYYHG